MHDLLPLGHRRCQQFSVLLNLNARLRNLLGLSVLHSIGMESLLPPFLDILHPLHGHDRLPHQVTIVLDGPIASLLELKRGVHSELFPARFAIGLRPGNLAWIAFSVEVTMAFGTAESERFRVVSDKHYAVAGIARGGAEITFFDAHI